AVDDVGAIALGHPVAVCVQPEGRLEVEEVLGEDTVQVDRGALDQAPPMESLPEPAQRGSDHQAAASPAEPEAAVDLLLHAGEDQLFQALPGAEELPEVADQTRVRAGAAFDEPGDLVSPPHIKVQ